MGTKTAPEVKVVPKLVTLGKGLKLAESWVNDMSGSFADESSEVEFEGRNPRLGLGAKVVLPSLPPKGGASAGPIERKLLAKLNAKKRRAAKDLEESGLSGRNDKQAEDEDDSDDEPESRTNAFSKKRMSPLTPSLQPNKKLK